MNHKSSASWPALKRDLIAILRGVKPVEVLSIGEELLNAGIDVIEVPLNSPDPFQSIELLVKNLPSHVLVGAGTVLDPADVARLDAAGGRLMISPNVDAGVLAEAARFGMVTMPGVFTPTEALAALKAGASGLKFFPASVLGPDGIKAISAILPKGTTIGAVGGVDENGFADYASVGVRTFGLGSSLYKAGASSSFVRERAQLTVAAYDRIFTEV
ncbi:2-dehydro-3-deoxy-6-phosphogalactonate aldolase [Phyllobacterium lublinensis]|uniref:2-dehydro-3-deoxy-6-phosphogalactonate aldolase n=1 Tax=Phyllobacterium lublinensis TaxID=2875708 RepID=UPI001CCBEA15|nr:2-dehydro-3-deoxy-6-phosphogalactonate aldolase [Phyllobacterium sp. 2063]MBZ9657119.1 2-dehydro-3-deoxy-6-phosphogalactonate aldolase [Phyllobacterium sp. 2063]